MDLGDDDDEKQNLYDKNDEQFMGLDRVAQDSDEHYEKHLKEIKASSKDASEKVDRKILTSRDQDSRWIRNLEFNCHHTLGRDQSRSNLERNEKRDESQRLPRKLKIRSK